MTFTNTFTIPAPAIDRRIVEDALFEWLHSTTGLGEQRVWWGNGKVVARTFPFATLEWLSTSPIGTDWSATEDLDPTLATPLLADVRLSASGLRRVVISVQCFDDPDQQPEASALSRLETAVAKLGLSTVHGALVTAGLGIVGVTGVRRVNAGQYVVELTGHVASGVTEDVFSIQSVELSPVDELEGIADFDSDMGWLAPVSEALP